MIWKRCTRGYLSPQWNHRSKGSKRDVHILKERELVRMADDSMKECEYKIGRVIHVFIGDDGVVRSASQNDALRIQQNGSENGVSILRRRFPD